MRLLFVIIAFLALPIYSNAQLYTEYSTTGTIDSLVKHIFASPSVEIYNVCYTGFGNPNDNNSEIRDIGFFNSLNSTVGIDSGLILTGGFLDPPYGLGCPASNTANYLKTGHTDSLLNTIIYLNGAIGVAILEFDFIPNGDTIKFGYVFASDEYPEQICQSDNDVFAFHISGAGISGNQNIALVPNSTDFVSINSINDTSCMTYNNLQNMDENVNCIALDNQQYYVDHTGDQTFIFNGSTTKLTAQIATIPCETYHLRFAIGEGGNSPHENSAVFLEANSFNSEPLKIETSVSYGGNDTVLYEGCGYVEIVFRRTYNIQEPKSYQIELSGTAINQVDYESISNFVTMESGQMYDTLRIYPISDYVTDNNETIIISIGDTLCNGVYYTTDVELVIIEKPPFEAQIIDTRKNMCDTAIFSLVLTGEIQPVEYLWNINNSSDSSIFFYPYFLGDDVAIPITINVFDACGNTSHDSINAVFSKYPKADFSFPDKFYDRFNSKVSFLNLSSTNTNYWFWEFGNGYSSTFENPSFEYKDIGQFDVWLKAYNENNCYDSISKTVMIHEYPIIHIPNAFTPDNNGINDKFEIKGTEIIEYELIIYNRWGEKVFYTTSIYNSWDGRKNNQLLETGVYAYVLKVQYSDNKKIVRTGNVTLIR